MAVEHHQRCLVRQQRPVPGSTLLGRSRSVEEGLPLARAANTGISAVIDATAASWHELGLGEPASSMACCRRAPCRRVPSAGHRHLFGWILLGLVSRPACLKDVRVRGLQRYTSWSEKSGLRYLEAGIADISGSNRLTFMSAAMQLRRDPAGHEPGAARRAPGPDISAVQKYETRHQPDGTSRLFRSGILDMPVASSLKIEDAAGPVGGETSQGSAKSAPVRDAARGGRPLEGREALELVRAFRIQIRDPPRLFDRQGPGDLTQSRQAGKRATRRV